MLPILCYGQVSWTDSGNNMTTGRLGLGTTADGTYDLNILRDNALAGLRIVNTNTGGRTLILFGEAGSNGKYGYLAHHSQSYDAGANYTQVFKSRSTTLVGSDVDGLGIISGSDIRFSAGGFTDSCLRMVLKGDGKLGIGTVTPLSKIHVAGSIYANSTRTNTIFGGTPGADNANLIGSEGYWALRTAVDNSYNLDVYNGGQVRAAMTVLQSGNVGIGTAAPDAKLAVKGTIHTQEVRVDLLDAMAPDYVFDTDYHLTPLAELKSYVDQNKHLPEVPSAREMEKNGLNLKEMNLLLLKKVEELTLHLIKANEDIELLQKKVKAIEKKIR